MKSYINIANEPASIPLLADDLLEFHAARIILLVYYCGVGKRIGGLTKIAKLDFFVRYPQFFFDLCKRLGKIVEVNTSTTDSTMIRYHYGPWDKRYYHVLPYLEAKNLLKISRIKNQFQFQLTEHGVLAAKELSEVKEYAPIIDHMKAVKRELGNKTGSSLKRMIYEMFEDEVAKKPIGTSIK